jgi:hypothetical protein
MSAKAKFPLIIIDDNAAFAKALCLELGGDLCSNSNLVLSIKDHEGNKTAIDYNKHNTGHLATAIIDTYGKVESDIIKLPDDTVIFININGTFGGAQRQDNKGIELLKWLRIKGVMNHCVMYSFLGLEELLRGSTKNYILTSKGVSFRQLPFASDVVTDTHVKGSIENLIDVLRGEYDAKRYRHIYANAWGIERLLKAHKLADKGCKLDLGVELNSDLNYNIAKFINKSYLTKEGIAPSDIMATKMKLDTLRDSGQPRFNIIFIDDEAEKGWKIILENILGSKFKIENIDVEEDFNKMKTKIIGNINKHNFEVSTIASPKPILPFTLIISDLRLFAKEEDEVDYDKLISVKLMKQIRDEKAKGNLRGDLDVILFTASNKLWHYKKMILGKRYAPVGLFIKEGFDMSLNDVESFHNYKNLITILSDLYKSYRRKAGEIVEVIDEDAIKRCEKLDKKIKDGQIISDISKIEKAFEDYTHILLDSNLFMDEKFMEIPYYLINKKPEKTVVIYPVFKEIERLVDPLWGSERGFLCGYFLELVKEKKLDVDDTLFDTEERMKIDLDFEIAIGMEDYADRCFVPSINKIIRKKADAKILFVTNDTTDKGRNKSATTLVKEFCQKIKSVEITVKKPIEISRISKPATQGKNPFNYSMKKEATITSIPQLQEILSSQAKIRNDQTKYEISEIIKESENYLEVKSADGKELIMNKKIAFYSSALNSIGGCISNFIGKKVQISKKTPTVDFEGKTYHNVNMNQLSQDLSEKKN